MRAKTGKHYAGPAIGAAGLAFLLLLVSVNGKTDGGKKASVSGTALQGYIYDVIGDEVMEELVPVFSFADGWEASGVQRILQGQLEVVLPLYQYVLEEQDGTGEQMTMEMILKAEAEESHDTEESGGTDSEMLQAMLDAENSAARDGSGSGGQNGQEGGMNQGVQTGQGSQNGQGMQSGQGSQTGQGVQQEVQAGQFAEAGQSSQVIQDGAASQSTFTPHTEKLAQVDMTALADYEALVSSFYTVDKSTMIGSDQLNVNKLSSVDMTVSKQDEGPQILIYHTHSQEAFADSVPGDRATSIVGVGDRLAQILTEEYGYEVLHHDASYDVPSRDDAYSVALPEIEKVLEEYPQIQVVIDLHRDAMDESTRLVTEIDGKPTARFMFFNGLSRTKKTGNISYLYNENLDSNLAFSFQLQKTAMEYYPGLTRKIYLKAYRYNMHLRPRNLLIELGAQNNTVEEAMNACDPLAHILDMVLSGQE